MMGSSSIRIHLRPQAAAAAPHPPLARQHAMGSGHVSVSNRGKPWLPSSTTGCLMSMGTASRLRLVSSCCTAGRPSQPSPDDPNDPEEEDPRAARSRKYRDDMDDYSIKYVAALNALGGGTSQDIMVVELETKLFRDEDDKFGSYVRQIPNGKGSRMALMVCLRAGMAIDLSTMIAANAHLRFSDESGGLSPLTVKQTLQTYVSTFLKTAEDASHMKFDRTSISSFLDAFRGLAKISHILFEDALAIVNDNEDSSSHYIPEYDVERHNHELNSNMEKLQKKFMMASESEVYELMRPTLTSAEKRILRFVLSMLNLRRKMVLHIEARNRQ